MCPLVPFHPVCGKSCGTWLSLLDWVCRVSLGLTLACKAKGWHGAPDPDLGMWDWAEAHGAPGAPILEHGTGWGQHGALEPNPNTKDWSEVAWGPPEPDASMQRQCWAQGQILVYRIQSNPQTGLHPLSSPWGQKVEHHWPNLFLKTTETTLKHN